jgi:hypothetical protein
MGFVRGNDRRNPAEQGQSEPDRTSAVTPGGPRWTAISARAVIDGRDGVVVTSIDRPLVRAVYFCGGRESFSHFAWVIPAGVFP